MLRTFWCLVVLVVLLCVILSNHPTLYGWSSVGGAVTPYRATARRLRMSNVGTMPIRLSKMGVYATETDAINNQNELLAAYQSSLLVQTGGMATFHGSALDVQGAYDALSPVHYVSLRPNDTLVVIWPTDVSLGAIRLGPFECSNPGECRVKWDTSTGDPSSGPEPPDRKSVV